MNKPKLLKIVNIIIFFCVLNQVMTGLGSDLLNKDVFAVLHPLGGILVAIFAVAHIALNWAWVKSNILK